MYFSPRSSQLFRSEFPAKARMTRWEQAAKGCILYVYIYDYIYMYLYYIIYMYICLYMILYIYKYMIIWYYMIIYVLYLVILLCMCMYVCVYPIALSVWKHTLLPQLTVNWTKTEMYWVLSITFIIIQKHSYLYWAAMIGNNMKRLVLFALHRMRLHASILFWHRADPTLHKRASFRLIQVVS